MSPVAAVKSLTGQKNFKFFLIILCTALANWGLNLGDDITFEQIVTPFHFFSFWAVIGTTASAYYLTAPPKPPTK